MKNAIDWASRPVATNVLRNKPVAVVGASTGMFGAVWAQAELRKVLRRRERASSRASSPSAHAHTRFDGDGLLDDELRARLAEFVYGLVGEMVPVPASVAA
ncbi:MAG: NAD(P)H-dependent oxidoreductase [Actinomycetota bacterium]|nr:NAD(P)H-dependent oxidoreductase [Actinomycetota bacterium]